MPQEQKLTEIKFEPAQAVQVAALVDYQSGSIVSREILKGATGKVTLFAFDEPRWRNFARVAFASNPRRSFGATTL